MFTLLISLLTTGFLSANPGSWLTPNAMHQYNTYGSPIVAKVFTERQPASAVFTPVKLQRPSLLSPIILHQFNTYGSAILAQPAAERMPASVKKEGSKVKK